MTDKSPQLQLQHYKIQENHKAITTKHTKTCTKYGVENSNLQSAYFQINNCNNLK